MITCAILSATRHTIVGSSHLKLKTLKMSSNLRKNNSAGYLSTKPTPRGTLTGKSGYEGELDFRSSFSLNRTLSCKLLMSGVRIWTTCGGSIGSPRI